MWRRNWSGRYQLFSIAAENCFLCEVKYQRLEEKLIRIVRWERPLLAEFYERIIVESAVRTEGDIHHYKHPLSCALKWLFNCVRCTPDSCACDKYQVRCLLQFWQQGQICVSERGKRPACDLYSKGIGNIKLRRNKHTWYLSFFLHRLTFWPNFSPRQSA